jgi:predicted secreted Zn-dependent protease
MPETVVKRCHETSIPLKMKKSAARYCACSGYAASFAEVQLVPPRMPSASRIACHLLAVFLSCGTWHNAAAEVIAQKSFSYFDISGNTADELDQALNARGPTAMGASSRHPGATRIRFGGQATYVESGGRCHIGGAKVTVDTQIILPRWRERRHAQAQLSAVWDRLSADIRRHEERHAAIAKLHAAMMEKAILALRPEATCDLLQEKVSVESERAIALHDQDQERFDRMEAASFQNRMQSLAQQGHRTRRPKVD